MIEVHKYVFFKNQVIYVSVVLGHAYMSFHDRTDLSEEQAKHRFYMPHCKEVQHLLKEKMIADQIKNEGKILLNIN